MALSAPVPITAEHDVAGFECQHASLSDWLRRRALVNQAARASRTFVESDTGVVVAYYSLAAASIEHADAPSALRRNMPDPIPVVLLARLAVDRRHQGQGLGAALLRDAVLRSMNVAESIGALAMLGHAVDAEAFRFYLRHGFRESPTQALMVLLDLAKVASVV
jgi:predicted N-acetyltransferase YhbS